MSGWIALLADQETWPDAIETIGVMALIAFFLWLAFKDD